MDNEYHLDGNYYPDIKDDQEWRYFLKRNIPEKILEQRMKLKNFK